jgi:uncharacterized membrane protein
MTLGIEKGLVAGAFSMQTSQIQTRMAQISLISLSGVILLSTVGAPLLARHGHPLLSAFLYLLFSPVCHQMPQRSFALQGMPWAVCHRCVGIYFGLFVASLLPSRLWISSLSTERRRKWALVATVPLLMDVIVPYMGLWTNTEKSRLMTGLIFGIMLMTFLLPGAADFLRELRLRQPQCSPPAEIEGGVS